MNAQVGCLTAMRSQNMRGILRKSSSGGSLLHLSLLTLVEDTLYVAAYYTPYSFGHSLAFANKKGNDLLGDRGLGNLDGEHLGLGASKGVCSDRKPPEMDRCRLLKDQDQPLAF
mmetsp:Transcript_13032/g.31730  ORF Transcript_13032/g.31730 Transcript_13032/m.31730 type:complete len:114 (+) Transcript_13032:2077-2418(+)